MDKYPIGQFVRVPDFTFSPSRYIEYENGAIKSQGLTHLKVVVKTSNNYWVVVKTSNSYWDPEDPIAVTLVGNDIPALIDSSFGFDQCLANDDRLLLMGDPFTMGDRRYSPTEPIASSIFTENGIPVKMSFTLNTRLIEMM